MFPAEEKASPAKGTPKKMKVESYKLTREQKAFVKDDEANKRIWGEAMESLALGPVRRPQTPLPFSTPPHLLGYLSVDI